MNDWISDLFNVVGYLAGFLFFAVPLAGLWVLIRHKQRRRIRFAGWAPWWYVGGQPDVPEELQEDPDSHPRRPR